MLTKSPLQLSNPTASSLSSVFSLSFFLCFFTLLSITSLQAQCENVDGGSVSFPDGNTETTILIDGTSDFLSFESTVDAMANMHEFTYVVTDVDGKILGIPPGNTVNFEPAGPGLCRVFGLSYTGDLSIAPDDNLFDAESLSSDCADLSSNHLKVFRYEDQATENQFFVSSNNNGTVGVFSILDNGRVLQDSVSVNATDADGIYYDVDNDILYQLNRDLGVVNAYSDFSNNPTLTATSTPDAMNGREIAVAGNKLVVADDVEDANRLIVYDITPAAIVLDRIFTVDINLWGIHTNGNQLIAIVDNSSDVATFDNFFNQPAGALAASSVVTIENMVRTHGIHYVADKDMMFLTDVGSGAVDNDGALVRIKKWSDVSADGMVSADEQIRVSGAASLLGNPVDIAFDDASNMVYVAERANGGGRVLGFKNPVLSGGIAPAYKRLFSGASAIHVPGEEVELDACDFVDGGTVALLDGNTERTIVQGDGIPDVETFMSSVDLVTNNHSFTYVITDAAGMVLGVPPFPINFQDFDGAGPGACNVYGLSYTGELMVEMGDNLLGDQDLSSDCYSLSHNAITINRIEADNVNTQFFVSSNTSGRIGVYDILDSGNITMTDFASQGEDADGIYYNQAEDVLYQLNRSENLINAYSTVSIAPTLTATSTSDFTNGREIAVAGDKLIVADDVDGANRLVVYNISPTLITFDREYTVDINLWGIHINGNQLIAIVDNSSDVAVFDNFFNQAPGALAPSRTITVENMVRTHGLTYVATKDMMFLTDVGSGAVANDGAFLRIKNWSDVSADGMISADEQIRVSGASSALGNPVDIAYDEANDRVYVAERANGGGRVLCFANPVATGGIAPIYNTLFAGASAIHLPGTEVPVDLCSFVDGGTVSMPDGNTQTTTIQGDGMADVVMFTSSIDADAAGHSFTYIITDDMGIVLGVNMGDSQDFDGAGPGACNVYGLSYTGELMVEMGDDLFGGQDLSSDCYDLSDNAITVNRIDPSPVQGQFFVSTNTDNRIGVFSVLESGDVLSSSFENFGMDADGIYYDEANDVIYQLNRSINAINAISNVSTMPVLTATSTSDFTNGREIAVTGNKLVVAEDVDGANKLLVYTISPTSITLDKVHDVDINLWGIHANGNQLIAIVDNSSDVATFNNFFNQPAGALAPSSVVTIENMVRTHGITYVADKDMMFLTDVGSGAVANDGAFLRIKNWSNVSADGMVSADEQIRVSGAASGLGNPVDIAYDNDNDRVYVAERANGGGRVLCFVNPVATGGIAPIYNNFFAGASAIHFPGTEVEADLCSFVDGGMVALADGSTEVTMFVDGVADMFDFTSTVVAADGESFTYVVTDADGMILGIPPNADMVNFDDAGPGACIVYGLHYTGNLSIMMGDMLTDGTTLSDGCFDLSDNSVVVNRIAGEADATRLFVSSNNQSVIGAYQIAADGSIIPGSFASQSMDADGIYYDDENDIIYQLNRVTNSVDVYHDATTATPTFVVTSSSDFTNGREIAVSGSKLVVADDVDGANRFVIYNITQNSVTLDKVYNADINLWGIHADGDRLIAISDNSSDVAIYNDFFNQPAGDITPSSVVTIENMVRTHGLDYDRADDMLILTDVGAGGDDNDGALVVVRDFADVSADGMVSADEQARAFGGADFLGNPVDVALDKVNKRIYVAERANGGGRLLGFLLPKLSGGIAPFYNQSYGGASAVFIPEGPCDYLTGGDLTFADGSTEQSITVNDGIADEFSFISDVDAAAGGYSQTFVVTDAEGMILGVPTGDTQDFEGAGVGVCRVYNVSYTGNLLLDMGGHINDPISDECGFRSEKFISVNRTEAPFTGDETDLRSDNATTSILGEVFPVPVQNELNVVVENTVEAPNSVINIFNVAGSLVLRQNVDLNQGINKLTFNVSTLENGMYFIQIPGSTVVTKFVKAQK